MLIFLEGNMNTKNKEINVCWKETSILKRSKLMISKRNINPKKKYINDC